MVEMKKSEKERGPHAQKNVQTKLDTKVRKDREASGIVLYSNLSLNSTMAVPSTALGTMSFYDAPSSKS